MPLSSNDKNKLGKQIGRELGITVAAAIDAGATPATVIAALGTTSNLSALVVSSASLAASSGVFVDGNNPTGAEINTAIDASQAKVKAVLDIKCDNADAETLRTQVEARLDAVEAKIDALIAALKVAGLMELS